jgi:hypothetical protein
LIWSLSRFAGLFGKGGAMKLVILSWVYLGLIGLSKDVLSMKRELENFFLSLGKRFRKLEASKMSRLCEERRRSGFCNASE